MPQINHNTVILTNGARYDTELLCMKADADEIRKIFGFPEMS